MSFVGVSLDHEREALEGVVEEKGIPWRQIFDGRGVETPLVTQYNVQGTPTFYLIDGEGRIAAKPSSVEEVEGRLEEILP